jgi:hypothetical protein
VSSEPRDDVAIAWCSPAIVSAYFCESIVGIFADRRTRKRVAAYLPTVAGPELGVARCDVVEWFLQTDAEWLLQIDSDQVFGPEQALALLEVADPDTAPIVSGLYAGLTGGSGGEVMTGLCAGRVAADGTQDMLTALPDTTAQLLRVGLVGAGFLLAHRRVYEAMRAARPGHPLPYFESAVSHGVAEGEDFTFCRRAAELGFPVHLATRVHVGHHKSLVVWPAAAAAAMTTATFQVRAL